jgi:uncharacterized damage-inducible protein DinB
MSIGDQELYEWKYPIGEFQWDGEWSQERKAAWISGIAALPRQLRDAVTSLNDSQLDTPYRPGGWTIRQVVHHMADSHMNSFIRFKLALTEHNPVIKPYNEGLWAELSDSSKHPVEGSLRMLESLHERWTALLNSMSEEDYLRAFYHPESSSLVPLRKALGLYDWHGRHHSAHITSLKKRLNW